MLNNPLMYSSPPPSSIEISYALDALCGCTAEEVAEAEDCIEAEVINIFSKGIKPAVKRQTAEEKAANDEVLALAAAIATKMDVGKSKESVLAVAAKLREEVLDQAEGGGETKAQ